MLMFASFYPSVKEDAEQLADLFKHYPEGLFKAVGLDVEQMGNMFASMEAFLATEHYSIMWPILVIVMTITLGSGLIAGEVEKNTSEMLLSLPLSRSKIYWGKYIAVTIIITIFSVLSIFCVMPFSVLFNFDIHVKNYYYIFILGYLFSLALFSITNLISSATSKKGKASLIATGIVVFMYAANILASFQESLDKAKYVSFFHYFDYNGALVNTTLNWTGVWVFSTTIGVCSIAGWIVFLKRDVIK
jgi:ABC-2 type transport system permease protein